MGVEEKLAELAKKGAMVLTKKSLKTAATVWGLELLDQSTGVIMTNVVKYREKEEIRHPDSPEGISGSRKITGRSQSALLVFTGLAKAGVKHGASLS